MERDTTIIEKVIITFAKKSKQIAAHSKPWTPWTLTYLLEIDDSNTSIPAELILYRALQGRRLGRRDPIANVIM